jgi:hypothetical protein
VGLMLDLKHLTRDALDRRAELKEFMDRKDFIERALHQPDDFIAYHVARELAELYREKTIVEGKTWCSTRAAFVGQIVIGGCSTD